MKVLYAASEALPFKASGGLAEVAGSLPPALRKRLIGARVVLPLYDAIASELREAMRFLGHIVVPVAWRRQYCGIFEAKANGVVYYLLDNQYYFKRGKQIYGYYDDAERFAFFSRAVLEILPHLDGWKPDILHCNDWQTALTPVFQTAFYAKTDFYRGIKTVFTIHNIEYQGKYGMEILEDVFGLGGQCRSLVEHDGCVNLMKGGIECADAVTTVSPTYAEQLLDPWYSHGLDSILQRRQYKLSGILNGIDTEGYDPAEDAAIAAPFSTENLAGKEINKKELQRLFGLEEAPRKPLFGIVSRLVEHKGLRLLKERLGCLLENSEAQLAVLGTGEWQYEEFFRQLAASYPGRVGVKIDFIPALSRQIYAGADLFLMPSKSEPCGLSQMIALRYGCIPIVRETGGLKDSVLDSGTGGGNGFTFAEYDADALLHTMFRAAEGYKNDAGWRQLMLRAMECDNSWGKSANAYIRLYKNLLGGA
ncbi:MAG: glycogen synthase GlgA [Oscillospiraceae bacterium]|jgi:starch synthase|nr:glycogen synthase GlgA [Oscillospiraceae bacterium]